MNSELLERLALDHALGQLSPDVELLLQELFATEPKANRLADEFRDAIALATVALKPRAPVRELPPRLAEPFHQRRVGRGLALAASFILGAGLSALILPGVRTRPEPSHAPLIAQAMPPSRANPPPAVEREVRSLPFWSSQRAYLLATAARQSNQKSIRP